jgi:hypothetical protein
MFPFSTFRLIFIPVLSTLLHEITDKADKRRNGGKSSRSDPFIKIFGVSIVGYRPECLFPVRFPHETHDFSPVPLDMTFIPPTMADASPTDGTGCYTKSLDKGMRYEKAEVRGVRVNHTLTS